MFITFAMLVGAVLVGRYLLLHHIHTQPTAEISGPLSTYVKRWHVVWNEQRIMMVVHQFFSVDPDPPHNHAGYSLSIVLKGRGIEEYYSPCGTLLKRKTRRAGQLVWRTPHDIHVLHSTPQQPLTTLFILLPTSNTWGFFTPQGYMEGHEFCKDKKTKKVFAWVKKR